MSNKMSGETYRSFRIYVDTYEQGVPTGRLYRPGTACIPFQSLTQLLVKMEQLLDETNYPQSYTAKRAFAPLSETLLSDAPEEGVPAEGLATFQVRVLFRQHASWQGIVTWVEEKREETFRSVLELILLMDSALGGCGE